MSRKLWCMPHKLDIDIRDACEEIMDFTDGKGIEEFKSDRTGCCNWRLKDSLKS